MEATLAEISGVKRIAPVMSRLPIAALALAACTTFHGVRPTDPGQGNPAWPPMIDSLQPTLRWVPAGGPETTYDLVIYEGVGQARDFWHSESRVPGTIVYYREELPAAAHKLEQPLEYDKLYFWSVRTRNGDRISAWSKYDWALFLVLAFRGARDVTFTFRTPSKGQPAKEPVSQD
jgi:hypothetical protein